MASTPVWIGTWQGDRCQTTGAATSPDGSTATNLVKLVAAPGAAKRIQRIVATHNPAASTTANTAGILRYFVKDAGTTLRLVHEELVAAATRSATVKGTSVEWSRSDGDPVIILGATDEVWVGSERAEPYCWEALGGIP